jgi:hypothetical protein
MFEIINNIVKEMNAVRNICVSRQPPVPPFMFQPDFLMPFTQDINGSKSVAVELNNINSDLNIDDDDHEEDDEEDEDEDEDDDDDEEEEEDDDDDDDDEDYSNMPPLISVLNDSELEPLNIVTESLNEIQLEDEIKIINILRQSEYVEQIYEDQIIEQTLDDIIEQVNINENTTIEKLQDDIQEEVFQENELNMETESKETHNHSESTSADISREVYRKMNLQTLKTLVITKGLCSDPSKMKKPELLKLLESNIE